MSGDEKESGTGRDGTGPENDVGLETYLKDKAPTLNQFLGENGTTGGGAPADTGTEPEIVWDVSPDGESDVALAAAADNEMAVTDEAAVPVGEIQQDPDVEGLESNGNAWILPEIEEEEDAVPPALATMAPPDPSAPPKVIPKSVDDIDFDGIDLEYFEEDGKTVSGDALVEELEHLLDEEQTGTETDLGPPLPDPSTPVAPEADADPGAVAPAEPEPSAAPPSGGALGPDEIARLLGDAPPQEPTDGIEDDTDFGPPLADPSASVASLDEPEMEIEFEGGPAESETLEMSAADDDLGPPLTDPSVSDNSLEEAELEIEFDDEPDESEVAEASESGDDLGPPLADPSAPDTGLEETELEIAFEDAPDEPESLEASGADDDLGPPLTDPSAPDTSLEEPVLEIELEDAPDEPESLEASEADDDLDPPLTDPSAPDTSLEEPELEIELEDAPDEPESLEASEADDDLGPPLTDPSAPDTSLEEPELEIELAEEPAEPKALEVSGANDDLGPPLTDPSVSDPNLEEPELEIELEDASDGPEAPEVSEADDDSSDAPPPAGTPPARPRELLAAAIKKHRNGDLEGAAQGYETVARRDPGNPACWINLGIVLRRLGQLDSAIVSLRRGISLNPTDGAAWSNLGNALRAGNQLEDAKRAQIQAISLNPGAPQIHYNLGLVLRDFGDLDEAAHAFHRAELLGYQNPDLPWDQSLNMMLGGDLKGGFETYDARFNLAEAVERYDALPRWAGEPAKDKTLLVHAEQGLGDSLQFCRYVPLLKDRVGHVIFDVQPPLVRLLQETPAFGDVEIHARDGSMPDADLQIPLLSTPRQFPVDEEDLPGRGAYLSAPAEGPRLSSGSDQKKVGIAWAGKPSHKNDHNRSIGLKSFSPLFDHPAFRFYSLQVGPEQSQIEDLALGALVEDLTPYIRDFADTASLLQDLDLVVTVDTSVAHLAGALGKEAWILLPFAPDWRWQLRRGDSPWYPSVRLFRQTSPGDWEDVFMRVRSELVKWARG